MTTTRLVEWFEKESSGYLAAIEETVAVAHGEPALDPLLAAARALSGSARLAGDDRVHRAASAFESGLRAVSTHGSSDQGLGQDVRLTISDLRFLIDGDASPDALDARVAVILARWSDRDPGLDSDEDTSEPADFSGFVLRETNGVADTMEQGIAVFAEDPSNREWLGAILRRQRALLGSARLDQMPVLPETLRAVEDLCELIVRLDVPVKSEWLDVFRCARDVLRAGIEAMEAGEEPAQTPALSRLRTLREELVARYGERAAAQAAGTATTEGDGGGTPPDPRQRAVVLRAQIADALGDDAGTRAALDELYDLLMMALR
jgi:hypothetical protein